MLDRGPLILIATVSRAERHCVELALNRAGWTLVHVDDADEAARQLAWRDGSTSVLVIDAGLLEMAHDAQWRQLRRDHPRLGTVVRCLLPRSGPSDRPGGPTYEVHPDDAEGTCEAVRSLGSLQSREFDRASAAGGGS